MKSGKSPLNFGERMKLLKARRQQEASLLEMFQPGIPLTAEVQKQLVHRIEATAETPAIERTVIVESLTPLERTIQRIRDQAKNI